MRNYRLVKHPVLCNYYLTYRCNAKCGFCDIWERPSPYATPENVAANLRDLKRLRVRVVDFTGGEPLLHRSLPQFLKLAKQLGFVTTVTTNCLLYPKHSGAMRGLVDMLHFSVDSPEADAHNASRGVACFSHVLESINIAKRLGERPDILFTVMESNLHEIERVYAEIARPNGLMLILNPIFEYNTVGGRLSDGALEELRAWAWRPNVYLNEAFLLLRKAGGNQTANPVCVAASSTIVISPENKLVLPCYHLGQAEFDIDNQLYTVWKSPPVQAQIALEGRLPGCQACTVNCYMQPSFAVQLNPYFFRALPSTLKYSLEKWVFA